MTFEGDYYRTENATIYDRPRRWSRIYIAAGGPHGGEIRRSRRRRLHLHQRQGTARSTPSSCCRTSRPVIEAAGEAQARFRPDDRDEGLVRSPIARRLGGHAALGGAGALGRGEDVGRRSAGNGEAGRRAAGGARQPSVGSSPPMRTSTSRRLRAYVELGFTPPGVPRPGPRPGAVSCGSMRNK